MGAAHLFFVRRYACKQSRFGRREINRDPAAFGAKAVSGITPVACIRIRIQRCKRIKCDGLLDVNSACGTVGWRVWRSRLTSPARAWRRRRFRQWVGAHRMPVRQHIDCKIAMRGTADCRRVCRFVQQVISTARFCCIGSQNRVSEYQAGKQPCRDDQSSRVMAEVCRSDHRSKLLEKENGRFCQCFGSIARVTH